MKNLFLFSFIFVFASFGFIKNSNAFGGPVWVMGGTAPAAAYAQRIEQYVEQGLQYAKEAAQLRDQAQMLANNPASALLSISANIAGVSRLAEQIKTLEKTAGNDINAYQSLTKVSPSRYAQVLSQMQNDFSGEVQEQLQNYDAQGGRRGLNGNIQTQLNTSLKNLSNAQGQTQAAQANGAIAGLEVQELNELNSNLNAQHTLELQQIQQQRAGAALQQKNTTFIAPPNPPAGGNLYK